MTTGGKTFAALLLAAFLAVSGLCRAEMIRELVTVQGNAPIPLEGVGIVTGLAGTGDKSAAAMLLLREYLANNNMNFDIGSLSTGNIALVRVKTVLKPFSRPGQTVPVSVTSLNDAKSLEGGELLRCNLFDGLDPGSPPVAQASGQVIVGSSIQTRGTVHAGDGSGAMQIISYPWAAVMNEEGFVRLNLITPDWNDAATIARQINQTPFLNPNLEETAMFSEGEATEPVAFARDKGQVMVRVPPQYRRDYTRYIGSLLEVPVSISRPAKIVVNRSRNSIVVTGDIRVNNAVVSLGDKTVTVRPETPDEAASYVLEDATPRNMVEIEGPGSYADLQSLIDTLNAMGLTTQQIITIFQELRTAGAIRAELIDQ